MNRWGFTGRRKIALGAVGFVALALAVASPRLRAQQEMAPLTAAQAAKSFMSMLDFLNAPMMRGYYGGRSDDGEQFMNLVSQKSRKALGEEAVGLMLVELARELTAPRWQAKVDPAPGDGKTVIAQLTPDTAPAARSLVCVQEGETWRVDIIATYTRWNELTDTEAALRIYDLTRVSLPGVPVNPRQVINECQSNMKQLALGLKAYVQDYDEKFPPARQWGTAVEPYIKSPKVLHCPGVTQPPFGYAYNWKLSTKSEASLENISAVIMNYESVTLKLNASGEGKDSAFRHELSGRLGANYSYADGHVKWQAQDAPADFRLSAPLSPSLMGH